MTKDRLYTGLAVTFAFMQTLLPTFYLTDLQSSITTVILVTLASVFTILKQRVSVEINDKSATVFTWILVGIAAMVGLNELVGSVHIDEILQGRLRTIIAALIGLLNIMSKTFFPTEQGKLIQEVRHELKTQEKEKEEEE